MDNPQFDAYAGWTATPAVDEQEATGGAPISEDVYRPPNAGTIVVCTQSGGDTPRLAFGANATWRINWFGFGDFCNYTRHYPKGTYNIMGRFTEGGGNSSATLWWVTNGLGTSSQGTSFIGQFNIPLVGWNAWYWQTLEDTNNNPVAVTFEGSEKTLQLQGPLADDGQTINAGFFMLVPVAVPTGPTLTASFSNGQISISFPSLTGVKYQVQQTSSLSPPNWVAAGAAITGNGSVQSAQFPVSGAAQAFYRVVEQ